MSVMQSVGQILFGGKKHTIFRESLVKLGFWCRHGIHQSKKWGNDFDQLHVCKACGRVDKVHIYYGLTSDYPIHTLLGYVDPMEVKDE